MDCIMKNKFIILDEDGKEVSGNFFISNKGDIYQFCDMSGEISNVSEEFSYFWLG